MTVHHNFYPVGLVGPDEKSLSWLNMVPDNKITRGKIISSKVKRKKNKAGLAFRDTAILYGKYIIHLVNIWEGKKLYQEED